MRGAAATIALLLATASAGATEKAPPAAAPAPPAPRGIAVEKVGGGTRADARLDGRLVAWTLARGSEDRRTILVLLADAASKDEAKGTSPCSVSGEAAPVPAAKPLRLVRVDPRAPGAIEALRNDVPGDTTAVGALDEDGDGRDDLVVYRKGTIELLRAGPDARFAGAREALVGTLDADMFYVPRGFGATNEPRGPRLRLPVLGGLRTWARDPLRGWSAVSDTPIPFEAWPGASELRLVGARVLACGLDGAGRALFATGAQAIGRDRLRVALLDPEAPPESRSTTCWAKLPGPERVLDESCLILDGTPVLAVTSMSSEKLSLFGEKRLRLFSLSADRSRTGLPPRFAVVTGLNIWQPTAPVFADVDGDSRLDLVLPYWKGLKDATAVLEAYVRTQDGGFDPAARRTEFDVENGEKSWIRYGDDADGDGRGDVLVLAGAELELHAGLASKDGRRLASARPSAVVPWPADAPKLGWVWSGVGNDGVTGGVTFGTLGEPLVTDLDGDGRVEVLVVGSDRDGARVIVASFR